MSRILPALLFSMVASLRAAGNPGGWKIVRVAGTSPPEQHRALHEDECPHAKQHAEQGWGEDVLRPAVVAWGPQADDKGKDVDQGKRSEIREARPDLAAHDSRENQHEEERHPRERPGMPAPGSPFPKRCIRSSCDEGNGCGLRIYQPGLWPHPYQARTSMTTFVFPPEL